MKERDPKYADLSHDELARIKELEEELEVIIIAYDEGDVNKD